MTRAKGLLLVLIGAGVLWLTLLAFCPAAKQNQIFPTVLDLFGDFDIPRTCALADDPYRAETIPAKDRCYAPIGYALERLFPSSADVGGLLFTSVGAALFLLAGALLLLPSVSQPYTYLYMVAPFVLAVKRPMSLVEAGLWFLLLCPLTVPVHSYGLNNWLENVAFLLLLAHAAFMQKRDGSPA